VSNGEAAGDEARAIADNFDKFPSNVREELLLKLADNSETAGDEARAIEDSRNKLPEDIKKELLVKLEKKGIT
jgi:hypothetical protein